MQCILIAPVFLGYFLGSCSLAQECDKCVCCDVGIDACLANDSQCASCIDGYWGGICRHPCPTNCLACAKEPVRDKHATWRFLYHVCTKCVDGKYLGDRDENRTCALSCPSGCNTCTSFANCTSCKTGKYGADCTLSCPTNCKNHICSKDSGECTSCSKGFSGPTCDQCIVGFFSKNCSLPCRSPNCYRNVCNRSSGLCEYNGLCAEGWFGNSCDDSCSKGCRYGNCSRENGTCFDECKDNYTGGSCCVQNTNCLQCSSLTECEECITGFYGKDCQFNCFNNCKAGCSKQFGECYSCITNKFGEFCNRSCSGSCKANDNYTRCNESNGQCLFGCEDGFYGRTCSDECINPCADNKCDHQQGICLTEAATAPRSIVGQAVGGLAGVAVVFVVVVVVVLFYRKRRQGVRREDRQTTEMSVCPYETFGTEREDQQMDYDNIQNTKCESDYVNTRITR